MATSAPISNPLYYNPTELWYNHVDSELDKRAGYDANVQQVQSHGTDLECGVILYPSGQTFETIATTADASLRFGIRGGAEMPHFQLSLTVPGVVVFTAIWTAYAETGNHQQREITDLQGSPRIYQRYDFSDRLRNVAMIPQILHEHHAKTCSGIPGTEGWSISWRHRYEPYCFNFDIAAEGLRHLTAEQRGKVDAFRKLRLRDVDVQVFTNQKGDLLPCWKLMTAMPVPTPPPFPFHGSQFGFGPTMLGQMGCVISLEENSTVQNHYRIPRQRTDGKTHIGDINQQAPCMFVNEKHYEVLKLVGLAREEHQLSTKARQRSQSQTYSFRIDPLSSIHKDWESPPCELYYCIVDLALQCDLGPMLDCELPLPALGSVARIVVLSLPGARNHGSVFPGIVIRPPKEYQKSLDRLVNPICLLVSPPESFDRERQFWGRLFLTPSTLGYQTAAPILHDILYVNKPRDIWKQLLLAQESHFTGLELPVGSIAPQAAEHLQTLQKDKCIDAWQLKALQDVFTCPELAQRTPRSLFCLICGEPGTGKSWLSAFITKLCLLQDTSILVFGPTGNCLDALERKVLLKPQSFDQPTFDGVFRLDLELGELHEWRTEANEIWYYPLWDADIYPFRTLFEVYAAPCSGDRLLPLWAWIESRTSSNSSFSLARHITQRLKKYCDHGHLCSVMDFERSLELRLLAEVICWYTALVREGCCVLGVPLAINSNKQMIELYHGFATTFGDLVNFYIRNARAVFCTARTGTSDIIRTFRPEYILAEDAPFLTETACLSVIKHHESATKKIILTGDPSQSPIILTSWSQNEFYFSESMSLFERLQKTGVCCFTLQDHHRMAPDVRNFISSVFYDCGSDVFPVLPTKSTTRIQETMAFCLKTKTLGSVFFVSVENPSVWQEANTLSIFNPEYVCYITDLVRKFVNLGIQPETILIISNYMEERRLLRELLTTIPHYPSTDPNQIEIRAPLECQGRRKSIVIVSTTRPGGQLGLGSISYDKLQCLATSRATDGLIIVGNDSMSLKSPKMEHPRLSITVWEKILGWMKKHERILSKPGDCGLLEQHLGTRLGEIDLYKKLDTNTMAELPPAFVPRVSQPAAPPDLAERRPASPHSGLPEDSAALVFPGFGDEEEVPILPQYQYSDPGIPSVRSETRTTGSIPHGSKSDFSRGSPGAIGEVPRHIQRALKGVGPSGTAKQKKKVRFETPHPN
ncbi:P-loop containing nucleoside triphosphate hydrolase protein [Aspergillus unguis]